MCVCVCVCACASHQLKGRCWHIFSAVLQINHINDVEVIEADRDGQSGQQPSRGGGAGAER